jgi:methylglyoxal synthase
LNSLRFLNIQLKIIRNNIFLKHKIIEMEKPKRIALVAHDNKKQDMINWVKKYKDKLKIHELYATGTTGKLLEEALSIKVHKLQSGPLGGDQQIGALLADQKIDILFFFWDPLQPHPHEPDVKALLRLAVVWNIPVASNLASADFLINSPLFGKEYDREVPKYIDYLNRPT